MNVRLSLAIDEEMTNAREDNLIRVPTQIAKDLDIKRGSMLCLRCANGNAYTVTVASVLPPGNRDGTTCYVSRTTFRAINEEDKHTITLGCDPEFALVNTVGRLVPASLYLNFSDKVGSDGDCGELRPDPGEHEEEVVSNIRDLVKELSSRISGWKNNKLYPEAHSYLDRVPIGFHVHLGAPPEILTFAAPGAIQFVKAFTGVLDYFVGIPAMILEDTPARRLSPLYGSPSDIRLSGKTIEYRTPGGFYLRHPDYTRGLLAMTLCVAEDVFMDMADRTDGWRKLAEMNIWQEMEKTYALPPRSVVKEAFTSDAKTKAKSLMPTLVQRMQKMQTYSSHAVAVKHFFGLLRENLQYAPQIIPNWVKG